MEIRKFQFFIIILFLYHLPITISALSSEENEDSQKIKELRPLSEEELKKAQEEIAVVDTMMDEFRKSHRPSSSKLKGKTRKEILNAPLSKEEESDYRKAISAYKEIIEKYEGTEIELSTQFKLSAAYIQIRRYNDAINQLEHLIEKYPGSSYETETYLNIGCIYLQGLADLKEAIKWFEKIPKPNGKSDLGIPIEYDPVHKKYISAQQNIAKCEIKLGKHDDAQERYRQLVQEYPKLSDSLNWQLNFELQSNLEANFNTNNDRVMKLALDSIYEIDPTLIVSTPKSPEMKQEIQPVPENKADIPASVSIESNNVNNFNIDKIDNSKILAQAEQSVYPLGFISIVIAIAVISLISMSIGVLIG